MRSCFLRFDLNKLSIFLNSTKCLHYTGQTGVMLLSLRKKDHILTQTAKSPPDHYDHALFTQENLSVWENTTDTTSINTSVTLSERVANNLLKIYFCC